MSREKTAKEPVKNLEKLLQIPSNSLFNKDFLRIFVDYIGLGKGGKNRRLDSPANVGYFLQTRASHVAQTALYGYLKTRAGTRFPEMFENPGILLSMNMAKWQLWLACLSDLTVYTGGLIAARTDASDRAIQELLSPVIATILTGVGIPDDAADEFKATGEAVKIRVGNAPYSRIPDDETAFNQSPEALYQWAPIADELKRRDKEIVINSMRFRWQEVRRSVRKLLDAEVLMAGEPNGNNR